MVFQTLLCKIILLKKYTGRLDCCVLNVQMCFFISMLIYSYSTEIHLRALTILILPFNYLQRCYSKEKSQKNFNFELRAKFKNIQWRLSAHFVTKLYFNLPFFEPVLYSIDALRCCNALLLPIHIIFTLMSMTT